ncbi:MAG: DAK2 domain-containing protein [Acidimicrobiia bacterium]|nr:DAK2 domain-containing protein [Acidimicrobiia bacterium]MYC57479.1 DAK2 domain-containing protein [Acidimicrobiia bacterium]MYG93705.1 DAK2 domain-containing protein [Acidimicrobiia bacterium]MYI30033.1 DAK2 domain-containing protein [Acidimicrobiia bacterium]
MALNHLDAFEMRATMAWFRDALATHRGWLNQLNVYPVPDGDTGTNMALTLESVVGEVSGVSDDMAAVCGAISHGSLMGARGNSGVILSQILRALANYVAEVGYLDAAVLAEALKRASVAADAAVSVPVEGTILTVVRDVANAAVQQVADEEATNDATGGKFTANSAGALVDLVNRCLQVGRDSLARTPELLPQLARARVVDAGGAGFVLLLDALATAIDGRELPEPPSVDAGVGVGAAISDSDGAVDSDSELDAGAFRYEVMFFLEAPDDGVAEFRQAWDELGDSIVIVGGDGLWNCHIHSNQIGASIEAGIAVGRPFEIRVTDLFEQVEHIESLVETPASSAITILGGTASGGNLESSLSGETKAVRTAVVAVSVGSGVRRIFESLGVGAIIAGGQTMNPATEDFVQAVELLGFQEVIVLPNNKNIVPVAEQVDACVEAIVKVVPTRAIVEGLAALVVYDPLASAAQNCEAMSDAAAEAVTGEVTRAVRDTQSEIGHIVKGQWLGLDRQGLRVVASSLLEATTDLLEELLCEDHELLTVIYGADATLAQVEELRGWLAENHPEVEMEVHEGNQPLYPFYLGVE